MSFLMVMMVPALVILTIALPIYLYHRQNANWQVQERWQELMNLEDPEQEGDKSVSLPEDLPAPVLRYFRKVLPPECEHISQTQLLLEGEMKIHPEAKKWSHFSSRSVMTNPQPGFLWDAKVRLLRGLHIRIADSYIRGAGEGKVFLQSAFALGSGGNHPKLNEGALYRYLAEAPWHPTSLLPQNGVEWQAMDNRVALARLSAHGMTIALQFRFNEADEIEGIYTQNRYGKFWNNYERYPWEGTFRNYQRFHGFLIPTEAEVGWHLPDGWWLFWRATVTAVAYRYGKK